MRSIKTHGGLTRGRFRGSNDEAMRILWINSMHRCAGIHDAMTKLTDLQYHTSYQHAELGSARQKRDAKDLDVLSVWFESRNPFDQNICTLRNISTGLTAAESDNINCINAESIGYKIQQNLDGVSIESAKVKRNDQVRTLACLKPGIMIQEKVVHIDPMVLFTRLTALLNRESNIVDEFKYEFTHKSSSLFKDGKMRQGNKAQLRNQLLDYKLKAQKPKNVSKYVSLMEECFFIKLNGCH